MGRKKSVLRTINEAANSDKSSIIALPIMCGSGKSTAISYKIKEAIEKNEGIVIITDRKYRIDEYIDPKRDKELNAFLKEKTASCISILLSGSKTIVDEQHTHCPVLMMTSQKFLRLKESELDYYLTWDYGKRQTIIFDEKPGLYFQYDIDIKGINHFETLFFEALGKMALSLNRREEIIESWLGIRNHTVKSLLSAEPIDRHKSSYRMSRKDLPKEENNEAPDRLESNNPGLEDDLLNGLIWDIKRETAKEGFYQFVENNYKWFQNRDMTIEIPLFIRALEIKEYYSQLYSYRPYSSGKYMSYYSVLQSELPKMQRTGANIVILDGTADLSMDYLQAGINVDKEQCQQYLRHLNNLTVVLAECKAAKREFTKKDSLFLERFLDHVKKETKSTTICYFTYQDITKMLKKEISDEEGDKTSRHNKKTSIEYFGNIKGRNDFLVYYTFAQIGVNICPESYYLSRYIDQHKEDREKLIDSENQERQITKILKSPDYKLAKCNDILADIEQNIFRSPVRLPACRKKVVYYIFYEFSKNKLLKDRLIERFQGEYQAIIKESDASYIHETQKTIKRKGRNGRKTFGQILIEESDKLEHGEEFQIDQWLKKISEGREEPITRSRFNSAKQSNTMIKARFHSWIVDSHKGLYKKS